MSTAELRGTIFCFKSYRREMNRSDGCLSGRAAPPRSPLARHEATGGRVLNEHQRAHRQQMLAHLQRSLLRRADSGNAQAVRRAYVIRDICGLGSTADTDDLILDFFAGSGTSAHAVLASNAQDGGNRRFILVQLPEPLNKEDKDQRLAAEVCDKLGKPRNVAELTKERVRRASKKIKDETPMFAGDLGFRVFKLDFSNVRAWEPNRDDLPGTLEQSVEHLNTDRTQSDILYELLLKLGLDLCVPIETRTIAGKDVHAIGGGVLITCLAGAIAASDVEALANGIAEWHKALAPAGDTVCVFRDSAFADDVAKTNLAAILQQNGLQNVRSL